MPRKTTAQEKSEKEQSEHRLRIAIAREVLALLRETADTLEAYRKGILRQPIKAISAEIEFLIAESEDYRDAAAQLFTESKRRPASQCAQGAVDYLNEDNDF